MPRDAIDFALLVLGIVFAAGVCALAMEWLSGVFGPRGFDDIDEG